MASVVKNPVVQTRQGQVRGSFTDGVHVFKGISYAAPPVGANRLRPPQPVEPWSGVRDALTFGPKPPQPVYPPDISAVLPELASPGEDCLNLNIWSPDLGQAGHPVMVWIPGSAFQFGTAATTYYDGSHFARDGVVCVTINYRVGPEGFLYLGEEDGKGNANRALLDQIAALEWVRENITAFGGDPDNVTVFGESGGAMSIGMLLSMPRARGLFRRAICQSGAAHPVISAATARKVGAVLAEKLGVAATREAIAAVPIDREVAAQEQLSADLYANPDLARWGAEMLISMTPWQPVADGEVLTARPLERIATGVSAGVDLLIGTNSDEWRLFLVLGGLVEQATDEALAGCAAAYGLPVDATVAGYRAAHPGASPGDLLAALQGDWWCRVPAIRLADVQAQHNPATYMYEFAWRTPQFNGRLGACHLLEVPFVFDTLGYSTQTLWGNEPPQGLADTMHAAWVAFATTGDPGWPQYDLQHRPAMHFDISPEIVNDPFVRERALWAAVQ
jgi:para-nitrobenzyl esterase